ncbi:MAG: TIGR04013 family B12-binding domain/radical SAM domain-containing protein [Candidatus Lokiarchaeota archaeon]|nr:TIGR04013 family B12-binding domain/radical SAM domain-containing protein [Candidatus Lokiarchaeota archaeon]
MVFIVYYHKKNIFSLNAIVAALETNEQLNNITIIFLKNEGELFERIPIILEKYEFVIIGFSFFTVQRWNISNIIKKLRIKYNNKIFLIAGGAHPSGDPEGTLKIRFDIVFIGESEFSIVEFLISIKNQQSFDKIQGIAYYNKDKLLCINKKKYNIYLNKYPPFPLKNTKYGSIEITRGCPYKCYFCQTSFMMGDNIRHRSVDSICKYIEILKKENLIDIRFITPNAFSYGSKDGLTINYSKLEELLSNVRKIIGKEGKIFFGSFPSEVRPEHVNKITLGLVEKYANNDNIIIGAQSGSQKILDICNRGHSVDDILQSTRLTIDMGFKAYVDFIFGLPYETKNDLKETLDVIKKLFDIGAVINAHIFTPLPQTPFFRFQLNKISEKTRNFLMEYNSKGKILGNWRKQEKILIKLKKELFL